MKIFGLVFWAVESFLLKFQTFSKNQHKNQQGQFHKKSI
jgi:hypothetical protein